MLDYLEEPDMFHDIFGHVPLLAHPDYADFMQELGKLGVQFRHAALQPFCRGAVVGEQVQDQGVVADAARFQLVDEPTDLCIGVLEEPGVHLHLAGEHRLEGVVHVVPRRDLVVAHGQFGVGRDDTGDRSAFPGPGSPCI